MVASRVSTNFGPLEALPTVNGVAIKLLMARSEVRWIVTVRGTGKVLFAPGAPAAPSSTTDVDDADTPVINASLAAPPFMLDVSGTVVFTTKPAEVPTGMGPSASQSSIEAVVKTQPLVAAEARGTG